MILHKLLLGNIDCDYLLSAISLRVPVRDRKSVYFFVEVLHNRNYGFHSPLRRIVQTTSAWNFDIFGISLGRFKIYLKNMIS